MHGCMYARACSPHCLADPSLAPALPEESDHDGPRHSRCVRPAAGHHGTCRCRSRYLQQEAAAVCQQQRWHWLWHRHTGCYFRQDQQGCHRCRRRSAKERQDDHHCWEGRGPDCHYPDQEALNLSLRYTTQAVASEARDVG